MKLFKKRLPVALRKLSSKLSSGFSFGNDPIWRDFLEEKLPIFWIVGPALSGKTTLAHFLSDCSNYRLITLNHMLNSQPKLADMSAKTLVSMIKEEMKSTFRFCQGYILDDFPTNMQQNERFRKKICKPSIVICITISLDGILGRTLAQHPTIDLNQVRVDYVLKSNFCEKLFNKYVKQSSAIKIFSQYPIEETNAKVVEYLETEFGYKFRQVEKLNHV